MDLRKPICMVYDVHEALYLNKEIHDSLMNGTAHIDGLKDMHFLYKVL